MQSDIHKIVFFHQQADICSTISLKLDININLVRLIQWISF